MLADHETFSNQVSRHLSVPNGMDPPEHTRFRRVVERYFSGERIAAFEPQCRTLAARLARALRGDAPVELRERLARARSRGRGAVRVPGLAGHARTGARRLGRRESAGDPGW
ncbi:MAG: hypothetical protein U5K43_07235 [Halofilum sp. (in: g-proteobacteria)]|nr:hypothetical protein [Halofilum sp. (in: g-proteobacteria)]